MIFSISGKKGSGKDTVGKIMQILLNSPHLNNEGVLTFLRKEVNTDNFYYPNHWEIKKFADKLKDIVCLLIGCTREDLESENFKSKELGEEWWYYKGRNGTLISYNEDSKRNDEDLIKLTPRLLLQLLGTECARQIIHPQIWVNSLMSEYKEYNYANSINGTSEVKKLYKYPNFIITDMRFPNELKVVKDREGISIRINRNMYLPGGGELGYKEHESETALDNYDDWDYIIDNNGTIDDLINQVRRILQAEFIHMKFYNERSN